MTGCEALSERMPEVARGVAAWTPAEAAHLAACRGCAAVWPQVQAASTLGAGLAVQPDAVAAAVRRRVAASPPPRSCGVRATLRWLVPLAAAVFLAVWLVPWRAPSGEAEVAAIEAGRETVLSELDGLTDLELQAVLDAMAPAAGAGVAPDRSLRELSESELERVLRSLGG
jgi:ferric-dicitrate binding protein FerR (iron transport regulator)